MFIPRGFLKEYFGLFVLLVRVLDIFAVFLSGWGAYCYKFKSHILTAPYVTAICVGVILAMVIFAGFAVDHKHRSYATITSILLNQLVSITKGCASLVLFLSVIAFFSKTSMQFSRQWFVAWIVTTGFMLLTLRIMVLSCLIFMRKRGLCEKRVVIFGAGTLGKNLLNHMQQMLWTGLKVVAFLDDNPGQHSIATVPVHKTPKNICDYLRNEKIAEIWIALPSHAESRVKQILHELREATLTTRLILDIFGLDLLNNSVSEFAKFSMLTIRVSPMVGYNRLIKAIEDRVLAGIILVCISPVMLLIAGAIKCSSSGPVFYRQNRLSWNGESFCMLKFRTMPVDAEAETGPVWAKPNEHRTTALGSFLRRTSLDELPQFINVLKGEMSIVGPRPERKFFVEKFKEQVPRYMQKHYVKAGITGWAQVNGWRGNTSLEKRIEYDLYYIEHWSLWFDVKIILLTIFKGFINRNAY